MSADTNTPDAFRCILLEGLLSDAQKGRGTDLEVLIPAHGGDVRGATPDGNGPVRGEEDGGSGRALVSFRLHGVVVAASSRYFDKFPEPASGRVIDDVDSESFSICVRFMYTGEYREAVSHENVSSVLHASELFQIDELKQKCFDYLEQNLDHSNYKQVVELADCFNNPQLKKRALRFQSQNSSRDNLLAKRESLVKKVGIAKYDEKRSSERKQVLEKLLKQVDLQVKDIFQTQHEQILSSAWEQKNPTTLSGLDSFRKPGTVGHLAYSKDGSYGFSSTYAEDSEDSNSDEDYFGVRSPPRPTEEQYEEYGIVHAHDCLMTAIKKAKPGDRIYLSPGIHGSPCDQDLDNDGRGYDIVHDLYFIGMGTADDSDEYRETRSVIATGHGKYDTHRFRVSAGMLGFYNIAFRSLKGDQVSAVPNHCLGSGAEAVISMEGENAEITVKDCTFELGTDSGNAHPTRVSGIFLQNGKSASIERCKFVGGAGSAVVVVNSPYLYTPNVQIIRNVFVGNGQPTFFEKSVKEAFDAKSKQLVFTPLPSDEITPGPSSLELWSCGANKSNETVTIKLEGNRFESNLRAPLAYRVVRSDLGFCFFKNDWQLHKHHLPTKDEPNSLVQGFDLTATDNILENNGLQFDEESVRRMLCTTEQKEKNICSGDNNQSNTSFPDGYSVLVIHHFISEFDKESFPATWPEDEPFRESEDEYHFDAYDC